MSDCSLPSLLCVIQLCWYAEGRQRRKVFKQSIPVGTEGTRDNKTQTACFDKSAWLRQGTTAARSLSIENSITTTFLFLFRSVASVVRTSHVPKRLPMSRTLPAALASALNCRAQVESSCERRQTCAHALPNQVWGLCSPPPSRGCCGREAVAVGWGGDGGNDRWSGEGLRRVLVPQKEGRSRAVFQDQKTAETASSILRGTAAVVT